MPGRWVGGKRLVSKSGENLIFLASLPRSGSTVLSVILGNHPEVYCPPEPWILLRLANVYGPPAGVLRYDDCSASIAVRELFTRAEFVSSAREFAVSAYNGLLERNHGLLLVDKTPRYFHILNFIEELFPAAKMIWLKRNPLDVAASYKTTWNRGVPYLVGETLDPCTYDFVLGLPNLMRAFQEPSRLRYELRYEDLVREPEREVRKLSEFCGFSFDPAMLDLGGASRGALALRHSSLGDQKVRSAIGLQSGSIGTWRQHLTDTEVRKLTSLLTSSTFVRMGYPEVPQQHPEVFAGELDEMTAEKARTKILDRLELLGTAQLATIYDLENRQRTLRQKVEETERSLQRMLGQAGSRAQNADHDRGVASVLPADLEARLVEIESSAARAAAERDVLSNVQVALRNELSQSEVRVQEAQASLQKAAGERDALFAERAALQSRITDVQTRLRWATEDRLGRVELVSRLQDRLWGQVEKIRRLQQDLAVARSELANVRGSRSFRIGRAVLWLPRILGSLAHKLGRRDA